MSELKADDDMDSKKKDVGAGLKAAIDFGPLLIFLLTYWRGTWLAKQIPMLAGLGEPFFIATAVFMVATAIALLASKLLTGRIAVVPLVSGIVVFVFGALTLYLNDKTFLKVKPTIFYFGFGTLLLGGLVFGKSLISYLFESAVKLDTEGWRKLTLRWALFFYCMAVANEIVWRNFSEGVWVAFKFGGMIPVSIIFMMLQIPLMMRHSLEPMDGKK